MLNIPGYTLRGAIKSTGNNLLFHAVRDADGLELVLKTPVAAVPGPRERERYRREFGILQRLRGVREVTRAHACEQLHERPVLLLEALEGTPLSELTGKPLEVLRVLELGISLASTLAELHRRGVIHKDLKPSNIILTPEGETRLIDFGIASLQLVEHVDATQTSLVEGTLAYMSPEQTGRMNRTVDYRTDLYSLGVTLYELLTGGRPFQGNDPLEWFHAHMALAPRPPHERVKEVPPVLSAIVLKLLAKVAEERYQSAEGLRTDLRRVRDGLVRGVREDFPLGVHDVPTRFQLPQRLYGRGPQVAALLQSFERVSRNGRPELVLVRGYSGMGKSSVVHELHKPVVRQRGFFLSGKFDQFQRDIPYATLAQAIRGLTQQLLAGTDEALARWRERLLAAWEGQGQVLVDVVGQLELVAGPQPPVQELPPAEAQQRFNQVFRRFLGVFATPEHPLVVFLDDLQWADLASLHLLQHLLTHPDAPPVLLIGAYRDNEVDTAHPLWLARQALREAGTRMSDIQLEPLGLEDVQRLVADTLPGAGEDVVGPLAAQVREKTGGNPFFLLQFLLTLNQDGLLARTPEGTWRWDAEGVRARGYSDNVVDFMVGKLRQLPYATQHLLRLAACVGSTFSVRILLVISNMAEAAEVEQGLGPALQEGLVTGAGPEQYRFLHDRIQQAAHALIPESERKAVHLHIGRLMLSSLSPEELREKLFDVVAQLNAGAELLTDPGERHRVARLNAEAGAKARTSTAFRSAITYLTTAFQLLPGDPWESDPEMAFELRRAQATCEQMNGNAAGARLLLEEMLPRARTRADTAAVYRLKSGLLLAAGEIQEAVTCLVECLERMGVSIPLRPSWEEVLDANDEVWELLGERSIESLIDLPPVGDPDAEAVMNVLSTLSAPASFFDRNLFILHLCRMTALVLRHGITRSAPYGLGWYGVQLGAAFHRYREAQAFGQLAVALVESYDLTALRSRVLYLQEMLHYWTQPLSRTQEPLRKAFQLALQGSEFQTACYCCTNLLADRLAVGHPLEDVYQESVARLAFVRKAGYRDMEHLLHHLQRFVQQLRGHSRAFGSLSGEDFDEEAFEATLTPERNGTMRCLYWILQLRARFLSGDTARAREAAARAGELTWAASVQIQLMDFHLYRTLTLAAGFGELGAGEQARALEAIQEDHRTLAAWARNVPSTFRAPERMVFAELSRLTGRREEALHAYEEALRSAREHGFIQNVALASELAARYWREQRVQSIAESYALQAREAYQRWGAHAKVRQLEAEWPRLAASASTEQTVTDTNTTQLDALTVVKAQQAISGEIVLERLASTLLKVAIENAGAQRGALLLPHGNTLSVVALSGASPGDAAPDSAEATLPWTLIAYVRRTREHVLLDDATLLPHPFSSDAWLERGRARSVLCLPLLRQEEFRGVLYLENCLATNAFTPARLALLGHLASQAAISIENARLYADVQRAETALRRANDELEKRVEERTRELRQAQAQLVETARAAGMAEVATNVLHNVGNVLTSAIINVQMMNQTVDTSRLERLKQVSTLFEEHRGALADFFTSDPRGALLPDYVRELTDELLREQAALKEGLEATTQNVEHIRAIVHVQQAYARNTLVTEECELSQLVEDALRMQRPALERQGVTVARELTALPRVRVDKHKVLQILINLLSNARNALAARLPGQRHLHVRLEARGGMACIHVVDNGMGIAPELRERLFTQGFTTREDGNGLGLHSSALAAQMLGGKLTLESAGPGQGATATLELPLGPPAPQPS